MSDANQQHDVVMIGAGPSALAAAVYTTREDIDTVLVEKGVIGGLAAITDKIDNYPGFSEGISGLELAEQLQQQAERFGAAIELGEVTGIKDEGKLKRVTTTDGDFTARAVLIATGSDYKKIGVPGEQEYYGRGVHYCATCDVVANQQLQDQLKAAQEDPCPAMEPGTPKPEAAPQVFVPTGPVTKLETLDLKTGTGREAKPASCITAHYHLTKASNGEMIESSFTQGQAVRFALNEVIPGWQQGIPGMKEGGERRLVIPKALAYGDGNSPDHELANEDLVFVVKLVEVKE